MTRMTESGKSEEMGGIYSVGDIYSSREIGALEKYPHVTSRYNVNREDAANSDDEKYTFHEFMQATTFHGVRYIFNGSYHKLRRIFWALSVFGALTTFIYQVTSRGITYFDYDTIMSFEVQYVKQLDLPTITICNHNSYRLTKVYAMGMHKFVINAYGVDPQPFAEENVTSNDLGDFMNEAAHQKTDFIESCKWNGQSCDIKRDFERIFTDYGVCYTFNHHHFTNKTYTTRKTGPKYGLRLTLNVETYEYMSGPFEAAGIQVLVHDKMEIPLLQNKGFSVRPGVHARVSLQKAKNKKLKPPHGLCKQDALPRSLCLGICEAKQYVDRCHCNNPHTADIIRSKHPVRDCTTYEALNCVQTEEEPSHTDSECLCELPCEETSYGTMLSYAQLSNLLYSTTDERIRYLQQAHMDSRDVSARVSPKSDINNILGMYQAATRITGLFRQYEDELNQDSNKANMTGDPRNTCTNMAGFTSEHLADINLMEAEYDRRVELVYNSYTPDMYDLSRAMEWLEKWFLQEDKGGRATIVKCAAMQTDVNFTSPKYEKECDVLTDPLLKSMMTEANYFYDDSEYLYPVLYRISKVLPDLLTVYTRLISVVFLDLENDNPSHLTCIEILEKYQDEWIPKLEEVKQKLVVFYDSWSFKERLEIYDYLYNVSEAVNNFTNPESPLYPERYDGCQWYKKVIEEDAAYTQMKVSGKIIKDTLTNKDTENLLLESLIYINRKKESSWRHQASHLEEFVTDKMTKTELAEIFDSDQWMGYISELGKYSDIVANHYRTLSDDTSISISAFQSYYTHLPNLAISFFDSPDFMKNLSLLMPLKQSCKDEFIQSRLVSVTPEGMKDIAVHLLDKTATTLNMKSETVNNVKNRFFDFYLFVQIPFHNFIMDHQITDVFFTTNFIKLDIFYEDFTYTLVSQKVALEFISYLSEIGGFLGLLLGASFLTVCELLDYICLTFTRKQKRDDK